MNNKKGFALNEFYSTIYNTYDLINSIFTFGLDKKWRNKTAKLCIDDGPVNILDLCCGTGDLTIAICKLSSNKQHVTGFDFNNKMLEKAKQKSIKLQKSNIDFIHGDASGMPFADNSFDAVTIGFGFRNLTFNNPDSSKHIFEIQRVIKANGRLYILESGVPSNFIIRLFYKVYLYTFLITLGTIISGNPKAYWYLAHSSSNFYKPEQVNIMLEEYSFVPVLKKRFFFGACNLFVFQKAETI